MNELTCGVACDLLPLYAEDMVGAETASALKAHLANCPACRGKYERMKTVPPRPAEENRREALPLRHLRHRFLLNLLGAPLWLPLLLLLASLCLVLVATVWSVCVALWSIPVSFVAVALGGLVMAPVSFASGLVGNGFLFLGCIPAGVGLAILSYLACRSLTACLARLTAWLCRRVLGGRNQKNKENKR